MRRFIPYFKYLRTVRLALIAVSSAAFFMALSVVSACR